MPTKQTISESAIISITSAEILTMGSNPIELLPNPGTGKYYEVDKIIIEFTPGNTTYETTGKPQVQTGTGLVMADYNDFLITASINQFSLNKDLSEKSVGYSYLETYPDELNQAWTLTTHNGHNPTLGNGTMRVLIDYTIRTFGA